MARKRASMRDGPLAELFRATEAAQKQAGAQEAGTAATAEQERLALDETVEYTPDFAQAEDASPSPDRAVAGGRAEARARGRGSHPRSRQAEARRARPRARRSRVRADLWLESMPEPPPLHDGSRAPTPARTSPSSASSASAAPA